MEKQCYTSFCPTIVNASIFFVNIYFNFNYKYMCVSVRVSVGTHEDQQRAPDPRELELLVVVSHLTWLLGTKFGSYERSASALNC